MMQNTLLFFQSLIQIFFLHLTEDTVAGGTDSVFFVESTKMLFFFCPNLGLQIKTFILHIYEETVIFQYSLFNTPRFTKNLLLNP